MFIVLKYNPTVFQENTSECLLVFHCFLASLTHSIKHKNNIFTFVNIMGLYLIMKHWFPHFFIFTTLDTQQWHTPVKPALSQLYFWTIPAEFWFSVICRSSKEYWKYIICQIQKINTLLPKSIFLKKHNASGYSKHIHHITFFMMKTYKKTPTLQTSKQFQLGLSDCKEKLKKTG